MRLVGSLLRGHLGVQLRLRCTQAGEPRRAGGELDRQLVAATVAETLVLVCVSGSRLRQDLLDLRADRRVAAVCRLRRVRLHLRPVERDQADRHQPSLGAQRQNLAKDLGERPLMTGPEAGNRGVVRDLVRRDHAKRDVFAAAPLDPSARALADRVRVEKEGDHHLRVEGGAPPAVLPVGDVEAAQVDRRDSVSDEPGEVILRQPLTQTRRQQELLITVASEEVEGHQPLLSATQRVA